jgi:hypothetical protein
MRSETCHYDLMMRIEVVIFIRPRLVYPSVQWSDIPASPGIFSSSLKHHQGHAELEHMPFRSVFSITPVAKLHDETADRATPVERTDRSCVQSD